MSKKSEKRCFWRNLTKPKTHKNIYTADFDLLWILEVFFLSLCLFLHCSFLRFFPTDEQQRLIQRYHCIANWRKMRKAELWLFSLLFWIAEKNFYTFVLVGQDIFIRNPKTINSYSKNKFRLRREPWLKWLITLPKYFFDKFWNTNAINMKLWLSVQNLVSHFFDKFWIHTTW